MSAGRLGEMWAARKPRLSPDLWLLLLPLSFLAVFYAYPLASIFSYSFQRGAPGDFLAAITSAYTWRVVGFTFYQAALSTLLTLLLGLPGAYLLGRYQFRGKSLLQALTAIPFVMPTLVVAAAFNALIGPHGWLNLGLVQLFHLSQAPLHLENSLAAILLAHVFYNTTIVLRSVSDFWSHLDPRLDQAARVSGANAWQRLIHITLPLLAPAIAAGALLVFIFDFTSFGVILALGGPRFSTLEVEIYNQTTGLFNLPLAASLALIQLLCTLAMSLVYTRLSANLNRPLSLRSAAYTQTRLFSWRSRLAAGALISVLLVFLSSPLLALAARSVVQLENERGQRGPVQPALTLRYYQEIASSSNRSEAYGSPGKSVLYSLGYALATTVLSLALGLPAAFVLKATQPGSRSFSVMALDALLLLPLGTSAVTLGLGFILALNKPPLDLRTSPLLIPLAHTLVALPFVVRSLAPALRSIKPHLRQSAAIFGARPLQVFVAIDLPLVSRALIVAATFAFTISLGEFGASALIARPEYPTIPILIYRYFGQPGALNFGLAMALSTLLMLVCGGGMLAIERLRVGGSEF